MHAAAALLTAAPAGTHARRRRAACPGNTYKPGDTGTCLPCPANMGTTSTGAAACMCSPGYQFHAGWGNCTACPATTYKAVTSNTVSCTVCPAGTTTTALASTTCVCRPGYGGSTMAECAPCPLNTYKGATAFGPCTECPGGTITLAPGATLNTHCVCPAGTAGKSGGPCSGASRGGRGASRGTAGGNVADAPPGWPTDVDQFARARSVRRGHLRARAQHEGLPALPRAHDQQGRRDRVHVPGRLLRPARRALRRCARRPGGPLVVVPDSEPPPACT